MEFLLIKTIRKACDGDRECYKHQMDTPIKLSTWIYCVGSSRDIETWQESCANSLEVFLARLKPDCSRRLIMAPH